MQVFPRAVESALLRANQGWVWSDLSELKLIPPIYLFDIWYIYIYIFIYLFIYLFWMLFKEIHKNWLPARWSWPRAADFKRSGRHCPVGKPINILFRSVLLRATLSRKSEQGFVWFGFVRRLPTNDFAPQEERASLHFSQVPLQFARNTQEDQVKQCLGKEPEFMHHWAGEGCTSNDHILVCMFLVSWFTVHRTQIFDNICIWLRIQTKTDRQCSCN